MNRLLSIIFIAGLVFLVGCQIETKYQCADGEVVNSIDLCSTQSCPDCLELTETEIEYVVQYQCYDGTLKEKFSDCEAPEKIIEYQCRDGTVKSDVKNCDIIQVNEDGKISSTNIDYKFSEYNDYAEYIHEDLESELKLTLSQGYHAGGREGVEQLREGGKVYFVVFEHGEWESTRYWAVEVNAETGQLLKYKEVTKGTNEINLDELWW